MPLSKLRLRISVRWPRRSQEWKVF